MLRMPGMLGQIHSPHCIPCAWPENGSRDHDEKGLKMRFYIFDNQGTRIGNPAGYSTMAAAHRGIRRGTKAWKHAWALADAAELKTGQTSVMVYQIKAIENDQY